MFFKNKKNLIPEQNEKLTLLEKLRYLKFMFYYFVANVGRPRITEEQAERIKKILEEDTNE